MCAYKYKDFERLKEIHFLSILCISKPGIQSWTAGKTREAQSFCSPVKNKIHTDTMRDSETHLALVIGLQWDDNCAALVWGLVWNASYTGWIKMSARWNVDPSEDEFRPLEVVAPGGSQTLSKKIHTYFIKMNHWFWLSTAYTLDMFH